MFFKKQHIPFLLFSISCFFLLVSCGVSKSLKSRPNTTFYNSETPEKKQINDSTFIAGNNFLSKNKQGLWELYVAGDPLERGLITGSLTQELFQKQEDYFLSKIDELVPSKFKQALLRKFLAWYNRKMYLHIPEEFKTEIYGLSKYASKKYNHIADEYLRVLYLHGAHDIGHALKDLALVGCSSFAVWGDKTDDGSLLIGRNFDFYAGDDFAKEKIISFVNPKKGHKFMSVTWGGMIGVVSGMNEHGLTVTINAGKSKIPLVAKTPISILTREILQYASNIKEAIAIAKKRQVFVSEAILVGSAKDKKAISIEVSPKNFGVYEVQNSNRLICSNHFQSNAYKDDKKNQKHIVESHSKYRFERMEELLIKDRKVTPQIAVDILRNKEGLKNENIGYGNEKALNQLLAHHAVVFKPEQRLVWVSSNPYQLGEFVAYDLNEIFKNRSKKTIPFTISNSNLNIKEDDFQYSKAYKNYERYRVLKKLFITAIQQRKSIENHIIIEFEKSNPEYWELHYLIGKYYYQRKFYTAALYKFEVANAKEVTTLQDKQEIASYIKKIKRKLAK